MYMNKRDGDGRAQLQRIETVREDEPKNEGRLPLRGECSSDVKNRLQAR